ncbi:hypothetical protein [Gracilibacillus salinarum]|uniref:DUF4134 domain-containing protein n=1 Tax=Gracilibacillus salinarum TaxID=2932255 RepID=A0ABY4GJ54_9BACI|nr:hypothetical protein [Gracilibacillus salinarum]UOQ84386.1 hypothetical protein MUN87_17075 [Gracilibacillus salinarum]
MESKLKKSGFYGFLLGVALAILFVDYKEVTQVHNGASITTYKPVVEYVISILRLGVIGAFIGLFTGWQRYERKTEKTQGSHYLLVFFSVFIVSIIFMTIFNW